MIMTFKEDKFYIDYSESRYKVGIDDYLGVLKKHGITNKKMILDVGCGPGQWTVASAILNSNGLLYGIDNKEQFLEIAEKYKDFYKLDNCFFSKMSYADLPDHFEQGSFDVILCNSVLQYIDYERAIDIYSKLLKEGGILLLFWNTAFGYYIELFFKTLFQLNLKRNLALLRMVSLGTLNEIVFNKKEQEYFLSYKRLKNVCHNNGIILERIENQPKLNYKDKFMGFDSIISCRGVKGKTCYN